MISKVQKSFFSIEFFRLIRFLLVGVSGTLLDFAILYLLKTKLNFPLLISNTISYSAGIINNFTLNRRWTFSDQKNGKVFHQLGKYLLVNVIVLILNSTIVILAEDPFSRLFDTPETGYLYSKVLATVIVVVWNYSANRLWTFK